jgi:hypothetical protein
MEHFHLRHTHDSLLNVESIVQVNIFIFKYSLENRFLFVIHINSFLSRATYSSLHITGAYDSCRDLQATLPVNGASLREWQYSSLRDERATFFEILLEGD